MDNGKIEDMSDAKTELQNLIAKHEILNDLKLTENELFMHLQTTANNNFVSAVVLQVIVNEILTKSMFYGLHYDGKGAVFNFIKLTKD